jgi:hypothetical protein
LRTLEAYGQFCLAGPTAELRGDPNAFKLEDYAWPETTRCAAERMSAAAQDVTEVMRIATKIAIPGWFGGIARKTRERVEQHWRAIEIVAEALLRQGTLTEAELIALVARGMRRHRARW